MFKREIWKKCIDPRIVAYRAIHYAMEENVGIEFFVRNEKVFFPFFSFASLEEKKKERKKEKIKLASRIIV